jgi:hypothetical protein
MMGRTLTTIGGWYQFFITNSSRFLTIRPIVVSNLDPIPTPAISAPRRRIIWPGFNRYDGRFDFQQYHFDIIFFLCEVQMELLRFFNFQNIIFADARASRFGWKRTERFIRGIETLFQRLKVEIKKFPKIFREVLS